ncbi:uncharacterized protein LOC131237424 [Magnolia sinica]|uniref:uncharacterized protein LOC131237424 n=1 Tax=Magnolia sinica TaxID=86752 RepID=UPI00265B1337|nr:uncharacterized protein LOC131237424 [Magnolia sinica]
MGGDSSTKSSKRKKRLDNSSPSSASSDSESPVRRKSRHRHRSESHRSRSSRHGSRRRESEGTERSQKRKSRKDDRKERRKREHRKRSRRESKREVSDSDGSRSSDGVDGDDYSEPELRNPESVIRDILKRFPGVADDLKQLLQMIDGGQAVDTRGMSDASLVKILKKLFLSLNLKQKDTGVFLLPPKACPTLEIVGPVIYSHLRPTENQSPLPESPKGIPSLPSEEECRKATDEAGGGQSTRLDVGDDSSVSCKKRFIGPAMPSSELLAAAARLTEAETVLREAELEVDNDLFIGPPPPAVVAEAESANEAERFEEVTRIIGVEADCPYDVVGVNHKMSIENIKKKYWKLSLMVHPDKCSHPQAHQAFVILNKAFKELQDPEKRKATDEKIRLKEEQEEFMAELKVRREAAHWRRLQGLSMLGDDELLAEAETKLPPKRDEWMTTLPPERKPGMSMQSTSFSRSTKEGRGDTSAWTDSPLDKAQKAKMSYLEAYNEATALAAAADEKKQTSDADLVDKYNRSKRSVSLMQKHQEEKSSRLKKKSKQAEKEEWDGQHPWKPWDREKDLEAGRQKVNLDSENMVQGLASRFSSGNIQRNFL